MMTNRLAHLQSILEILGQFDETGDFTRTWQAIIRDTVYLMAASRGTLFLLNREKNLLIPRVWFGLPWQGKGKPRPYKVGEGIAGLAWQTGTLQVVDDTLNDNQFRPSHSPLKEAIRSILCVPIRVREHVIGVIAVDSPKIAAFDSQDQRLLATLARHVARAWEQAKLFHGLEAMSKVGQQLNSLGPSGDYDAMLREIAERALEVVAAGTTNRGEATAVLYRYDEAAQQFDERSSVGIGFQAGSEVKPGKPRPDGLGTRAVRQRRRILSYEEAEFEIHPTMQADDIVTMVAYPLLAAGKVLGVLYISLRDERPFTRQELLLLDNFVNQAALAFYYLEYATQVQRALAISETFAAVGDIAANLMHRLNNQVGTIPVRVQGIQQKSPAVQNDPYLARNLAAIEYSARSAMKTVRETVRHLRPIELAPVSTSQAIKGALAEANLPPTITVKTKGIDQLPLARAGAPQLQLIFLNLLENAKEAMKSQGTIMISGIADEQLITLTMTDTGPGIPHALREHIFELNVSTGSERSHLGFGLWWIRSNLHRCGGDITIQSPPGKPASFRITLLRWQQGK